MDFWDRLSARSLSENARRAYLKQIRYLAEEKADLKRLEPWLGHARLFLGPGQWREKAFKGVWSRRLILTDAVKKAGLRLSIVSKNRYVNV